MRVGVAREIKAQEYRVALTPQGVRQLRTDGHEVLVEHGAGVGSGFSDDDYRLAGGALVERAILFGETELLVKVKEPLATECALLRPGQMLFTYLHLAPNRPLVELLLASRVTAFAYETLEKDGRKPLLEPMSEIAGRMAPIMGSYYLQRPQGGNGLLPCGMPGVPPARAVIVGAGTVGAGAARIALGIGMETVVLNRGVERLQQIDQVFRGAVRTRILADDTLHDELSAADIVIGALYATGSRTPVVITGEMLARMKPGAVIVDVAIDQGGCVETSHPTTHDEPVYSVSGIIHYCVANMPGAYPRTSTLALTNATLPYIRILAKSGSAAALQASPELASALNLLDGRIVHQGVAAALGLGPAPDIKSGGHHAA
ncbi:alanine dehydrogenase [Geobacter pelophilus]|uniref:Alanine dehydrogenase n=1 Tax=Geoanaerobacter pelophilus TaxID=60036 RepID=A0AAW4L807_9BACT|nr:alanine dehydrogenase [Geoanaerobacter pelophilus]MBT0664164.1 alanine dehydrogenase [Geoanaerobacter pelophilus]